LQHFTSMASYLREFIRVKFNATEDVLSIASNSEFFLEMQEEMRGYVRTLIKARQLKRIVMIFLSNNLVPVSDRDLLVRMEKRYSEEV